MVSHIIKNSTRVGVARTSLLRTFSCSFTDSAKREDSSLTVKRDETVKVEASTLVPVAKLDCLYVNIL